MDIYGIHGARQSQLMAEKHGICLAINMPVFCDASLESERNEMADKLKESDKATVIVMFMLLKTVFVYLHLLTEVLPLL